MLARSGRMTRLLLASISAVALALVAIACGGGSPSAPSVSSGIAPGVTGGSGAAFGTATIGGSVIRAADAASLTTNVSVAGTPLSAAVDNAGTFQLAGVPTGDVQLVFGGSDSGSPTVRVANVAD